MNLKHLALSAACAVALVGPAVAGVATLTNHVFKEDGSKLEALAKASPGQQVVYVMIYHNGAPKPAERVVLNSPVPQGLQYAGPRDGPVPEVSVDGGQSFGPLASLKVRTASGAQSSAGMADVNSLRWTLASAVAPGGDARVSFRARVR